MADEQEPEMIRRQMQAQRAALDQKLDNLENRIVQTVEGAREAVAETIQTVRDSVQSSVETVKGTVQSSVDTVKETLDVKRQVERHPWAMVGGAIAVGFVAGWLVNRANRSAARQAGPAWSPAPYAYPGAAGSFREDRAVSGFAGASSSPASSGTAPPATPPPTAPPARSWIDELSEKFAPEIQKAKGIAIGAALGVVREMVNQAVPDQLRPQVSEIMNGITTKLGGEPVTGELLEELLPHHDGEHHNGHHRAREEEMA